MLPMSWVQDHGVGRSLFVLAAVVTIGAVTAGCGGTVRGTSEATAERAGETVQWGPCQVAAEGDDDAELPDGAQCGKLTVPVDYAKPDAGNADVALIRFPATGEKIGSLVINPGGPGGSGVDLAVGSVDRFRPRFGSASTSSASTLAGLVRRRRHCAATPTPRPTPRGPIRRSTTAPKGVAHIEDTEKEFVQRCVDRWARTSSRTSEPPMSSRISTPSGPRSATTS